jgi:hypothetical protein
MFFICALSVLRGETSYILSTRRRLNPHRSPLSATYAQCSQTAFESSIAECPQQRDNEPCSCCSNRVAESNRSTVHVQLGRIEFTHCAIGIQFPSGKVI